MESRSLKAETLPCKDKINTTSRCRTKTHVLRVKGKVSGNCVSNFNLVNRGRQLPQTLPSRTAIVISKGVQKRSHGTPLNEADILFLCGKRAVHFPETVVTRLAHKNMYKT